MKTDNSLWGCRRISDEVSKLNIEIHQTTVDKIIQTFRKQGKIQPTGTWTRFLKTHWESMYGMDFLTIDTLFGKRFYPFVMMQLKTRKIVCFDVTENPCREFVKQRIFMVTESTRDEVTLVHDNTPQFKFIDYGLYDVKAVSISTSAPHMNAYVERFFGSLRRAALDHFLLLSRKQVMKIISEYIHYHNDFRPHQGVNQIPAGYSPQSHGELRKKQILGGLRHNYYQSGAWFIDG